MPPKKKAKGAANAAPSLPPQDAVPPPAVAAEPVAPSEPAAPLPLHLTEGGVDALRTLARHRPQRLQVGGIGLVSEADAAAAAPVPPPVMLQIVNLHRYFVDQRFWALVGVPPPVVPAPAAAAAAPQQQLLVQDNSHGLLDDGASRGNGSASGVTPAVAAQSAALAAFDEYSDLHVAYDLLLSDGRQQVKVLLSPLLFMLVEQGGLLPTGVVRVREATMRFDETVVGDRGFILLRTLDVVEPQLGQLILVTQQRGGDAGIRGDLIGVFIAILLSVLFSCTLALSFLLQPDPDTALSYPSWVAPSAQTSAPLIGGPRSYYLSLFNDDTVLFDPAHYPPLGEAERVDQEQRRMRQVLDATSHPSAEESKRGEARSGAISRTVGVGGGQVHPLPLLMQDSVLMEPDVLNQSNTISIRRLLREGVGFQPGDRSIVCRVFAKSRIFNFGRKSLSRPELLRAPFNFELLVGDGSGEQIKVVMWNTLVGAYWARVHVGQTIAIRGFRLKVSRADHQVELALNPYNPVGSLRILSSEDEVDPVMWEALPPLEMNVSTVQGVRAMPEEAVFDVAGVVTYASPMRREWNANKKQFYQYRWLLVVDRSCTDALPVKVFTNSQEERVAEVRVSDVIYLSNLVLHSSLPQLADPYLASRASLPGSVSLLATSSPHTQILDVDQMGRSGHPYLRELIAWSQQEDHGQLRCYPSLYTWALDFPLYRSMFGDVVTPLREVPRMVDQLRLWQLRAVLLQVVLEDIIVHPAGLREVQAGIMEEEQYELEMRRLQPQQPQQMLQMSPQAEAGAAAAASPATAANTEAPVAKKSRNARFAKTAEEAEEDAVAASQSSTVSTRSRRATRSAQADAADATTTATAAAATSRRGRKAAAAVEEEQASSQGRGRGRRAASAPAAKVAEGSAAEGRRVSAPSTSSDRARFSTPTKRRGRLVKIVQRKRKSHPPEAGAESAAVTSGTAAAAVAPSVPTHPVVAPSPTAPSLVPFHPSAPSVLATLVLRDLNGEFSLRVELDDPVIGHVNSDRAVGSIAANYRTPAQAARVFLGLARILPVSMFTQEEWTALMMRASTLTEPPAVAKGNDAAATGTQSGTLSQSSQGTGGGGGGGGGRKRGRAAASVAVPSPDVTASAAPLVDATALIRAAIVQLHSTLLAALSPFRLLCSAQLTRASFTHTTATISAVLQAD